MPSIVSAATYNLDYSVFSSQRSSKWMSHYFYLSGIDILSDILAIWRCIPRDAMNTRLEPSSETAKINIQEGEKPFTCKNGSDVCNCNNLDVRRHEHLPYVTGANFTSYFRLVTGRIVSIIYLTKKQESTHHVGGIRERHLSTVKFRSENSKGLQSGGNGTHHSTATRLEFPATGTSTSSS